MKKLILYVVLGLFMNNTQGQTSNKPCSPYRADQSCKSVKESPYRIDIKKPETQAPTYIRSTRPSGQVDYSKPQWKIVGDRIYQLSSTGRIDYSKPTYRLFDSKYYQTGPSGDIDFSKPSFSIE